MVKQKNSSSKIKTKNSNSSPKKPTPKKTNSGVAKKTVHTTEPYHPAFGIVLLIVCAIIAAVLLPVAIKSFVGSKESDATRFAAEYSEVDTDNVFVYKTAEETKNILEHGTGIVYLGFPECPWCQAYVPMLNALAKEYGVKEIYYYNIHDDRENDTEFYKELVSILGDYLQYNNVGEKRIYVPNITFVVDGKIIGNDWETSKDTLGLKTPEEYWTEERVATWQKKVSKYFEELKSAEGCTTTCNE